MRHASRSGVGFGVFFLFLSWQARCCRVRCRSGLRSDLPPVDTFVPGRAVSLGPGDTKVIVAASDSFAVCIRQRLRPSKPAQMYLGLGPGLSVEIFE